MLICIIVFLHQKLIINYLLIMMSKQHSQAFKKKYAYDSKDTQYNNQLHQYQTPSKYHTIESKHTMQPDLSNANFSIESSRIADQTQQISNKFNHYEDVLRRKLQNFEAETCQLLQKKERDNYFLNIQLQNYQVRLQQCQEINLKQKDQIGRLRNQIQKLLTQNHQLTQKNEYLESSLNKMSIEYGKLKDSFQLLKQQKNQCLKNNHKNEYMSVKSNYNSHYLKKEVQDLKIMVAQMEQSIKNCPSCFSLRRENDELNQAYDNLKKIYNQLNHKKLKHEKDLLQNITVKIQENQNIIRENVELKEKKAYSNILKNGRQKFKQSVAKRCRTLTDQF